MLTKVFILWVFVNSGTGTSHQENMSNAVYHTEEACEKAGTALSEKFSVKYLCTEQR